MWKRNCPECNKKIYYKLKNSYISSNEKNTKCKSCTHKFFSDEHRKHISKACRNGPHAGKNNSMYGNGYRVTGKKNGRYGRKGEDCPVYGIKNGNYGKGYYKVWIEKYGREKADDLQLKYNEKRKAITNTPEFKERMSKLARIRIVEKVLKRKGQKYPFYNIRGCEYFNWLMEQTNTFIQHAENNGEFLIKDLGYWVDGYDKENNIVYEFDEKSHYKDGALKERDIKRQKEIEEFLKCKFIRIKDDK